MRNRILFVLAFVLLFLMPVRSNAQTRVLVGVAGAQSFDNSSVGVTVGLEIPVTKHIEIDLNDIFSPFESHVALGGGRANIAKATGRVWFNRFGIFGGAEDSSYNVTKVAKDDVYAFGGVSYRAIVGGAPARFSLSYLQEFNNGVSPTGLETPHLQGADIGFTMRFGCLGLVCIRNSEDFVVGHVLTQGNPICDGTYGITGGNGPNGSCPRTGAISGGVSGSIVLEFPRRRKTEHDVF
jgi:hypothetical protein